MSARRMVLRRQWISDCPPQFNRRNKQRAAAELGGRLRPRMSWSLWLLQTFYPERYKELERRARERDKTEERAEIAKEAADEREAFVEATQ